MNYYFIFTTALIALIVLGLYIVKKIKQSAINEFKKSLQQELNSRILKQQQKASEIFEKYEKKKSATPNNWADVNRMRAKKNNPDSNPKT